MKRFLLLCLLLMISLVSIFSQKAVAKRDTIKPPIKKIVFDQAYRADTLSIDTNMYRLHILNPAFIESPWFSYLTRSAYPVEWLQFNKRDEVHDLFYPSWFLQPYITLGNNNYFYQTKRQFSNLHYKTSGDDGKNEEQLFVLHTQNISAKSNLGLLYNMNSSILSLGGPSKIENASDNALDVFYRYSGKTYRGYFRFYLNSIKLNETGGIVNDNDLNYGTQDAIYGLSRRLKMPQSKYKKTGFLMTHELNINKSYVVENQDTSIKDSLVTKRKTFGSIMYVFNIETNKRTYIERQRESLFYKNFYSSSGVSNDSITLNKLSNRISLRSPFIVKYLPDMNIALTNDLYEARFGVDSIFIASGQYSLIKQNSGTFHQTYVSANAKQAFGYIDWDFSWNSYLLGYGVGDQQINVTANLYANKAKTIALQLNAQSNLKTPSFMLMRNFSNHFNYNFYNNFKREKRQELSSTLRLGGKALELTGSYLLLNDFVYFDTLAIPRQAESMNLFTGEISSGLKFWKIYTINKAVWQEHDAQRYVHVPRWMLYHSMNLQHTFHFRSTGGRLFTQLGYDVTYTSSFKAANYMPATGVFFLQDGVEIGNYAKIDVHLSMKVKTVSFFVKLSHVNSAYTIRQFTALHYPMMPLLFSYGVNWLFYD